VRYIVKISWLGDAALRFEWPASGEDGASRGAALIAARAERVRTLRLAFVRECVPALRSVTVHLDLGVFLESVGVEGAAFYEGISLWSDGKAFGEANFLWMERILQEFIGDEAEERSAVGDFGSDEERLADDEGEADAGVIRLPVIYGGEAGPDLAACAQRCGMSPEAFIRAHASAQYEVAMIGFTPGFPYMTGLPEALAQPRHASPRLQVPPGAVGVAGAQTGIYPVRSPGGWQWIGRTPVPLFRPEADEPFLLKPGDRVAFVPTSAGANSIVRERTTASLEDRDRAPVRVSAANRAGGDSGVLEVFKHKVSAAEHEDNGSNALEVRKPGMLTTVQDRGRCGWQSYGVSVGGAMDAESLRTANLLVGNPADAAGLEMTAIGAEFRIVRDILAAACGADLDARVDGEAMPLHRPVWLRAGTVLSFGKAKRGCRAYLVVMGGVTTPKLLGSRSADLRFGVQGPTGRALAAGDRVPVGTPTALGQRIAASLQAEADRSDRAWASARWAAETASWPLGSSRQAVEIRLLPGAQWEEFSPEARRHLLRDRYQITTDSDRMGLRLSGPLLTRNGDRELASHGVAPGTIQVPAGGKPIILAAGCQPTGGYPVIAHVVGADLPLLAQCLPGAELTFRLVGREEAWQAWMNAERQYRLLHAGVQLAARGHSS